MEIQESNLTLYVLCTIHTLDRTIVWVAVTQPLYLFLNVKSKHEIFHDHGSEQQQTLSERQTEKTSLKLHRFRGTQMWRVVPLAARIDCLTSIPHSNKVLERSNNWKQVLRFWWCMSRGCSRILEIKYVWIIILFRSIRLLQCIWWRKKKVLWV